MEVDLKEEEIASIVDKEIINFEINEEIDEDNLGPLGLELSIPRKGAMYYVKVLKKSTKKFFQELRSRDGIAKGQVELTNIIYARKGKILPIAPWISLHGMLRASTFLTSSDS